MALPTPAQLADLRAAAHRDVDAIFDSWPGVLDQAEAGRRHASDLGGRRSKGDHSDPTATLALADNPALQWLRDASDDIRRLQARAVQAETIIGSSACAACSKPISGPTTDLAGRLFHDPCLAGRKAA